MGGKIFNYLKSFGRSIRAHLKNVKNWQLILILIPLLFVAATLLRFDHLKMTDLRDQILAADEEGDSAKIAELLPQLKDFTERHTVINVVEKNGRQEIVLGTGPFYLENMYLQKATSELNKAQEELERTGDNNPNGNIFAKASAVCQPIAIQNGWHWSSPGYLECMTGEINKYPALDDITTSLTANIPSTNLYRYDFASPIWAPLSLSGFVLLLCALLAVVIIIRIVIWVVLRLALLIFEKRKKV